MSITSTTIFCGMGGDAIGFDAAGYDILLAANHLPIAIDTHSANFPDTDHLLADVSNYDMRKLPRTDVLWASPECTWHSPAGGRKRLRAQLDLLDDYVPTDAGVRSRATMFDVIRAAEAHRYSAVVVENVVEVTEWELYQWWLSGMRSLGYQTQTVCVSSAHIGSEGNPYAPQWRDRIYFVFTRKGIRRPNLTPRPPAWCFECDEQVRAMQAWRNPRRPKIGKYRQQYDYRCPNVRCRNTLVEPYVLPAAAAIDWTNPGTRIGDRRRPLAENTMRRIRAGLEMFAEPTVVRMCGTDPAQSSHVRAWPAAWSPLVSRLTSNVDGLVLPVGGPNHDQPATYSGEPLRTRLTRDTDALVTPPYVVELRNNCNARGIDEPLTTIAAEGRHHCVVVPPAFYVKNYGGNCRPQDTAKPVTDPLSPITTRDHHALVIPYRRTNRPATTGEPLTAVSTREHAALVHPAVDVEDCYFRMLQPREHARAQRVPDSYRIKGNKSQQTLQAGNAVSANVAQWIGERLMEVLA